MLLLLLLMFIGENLKFQVFFSSSRSVDEMREKIQKISSSSHVQVANANLKFCYVTKHHRNIIKHLILKFVDLALKSISGCSL